MLSGDSKTGITFNGEIYGYKKIKENLKDYKFKTNSDTEVILALHQKFGEKMMSRIPGMFAFAVWNDDKQELFCARDRFGEKPFYYTSGSNGEFIFASEIKSIVASGLISPILNKNALEHYLKYLHVAPYETIYSNIHVLPPAHCLTWKNGQINISRYWRLPEVEEKIEKEEAVEEFRRLFAKAVESQMIADVPVGAFLSGGLDSSSVVAVASRFKNKIKTFSFGFGESINELPYAREVAKMYGTEHTELRSQDSDIAEMLIKMADIYDEPFADSSNIPTYLLSKSARPHSKAILTGDGADELLAGYEGKYHSLFFMEKENNSFAKEFWTRMMISVSARLDRKRHDILRYKNKGMKLKKDFNSILEANDSFGRYFSEQELSELIAGRKNKPHSYHPNWQPSNTVDDALRYDIENYLPGDILVKTDRASMANGLEFRSPFLDADLASFCISLPESLKISEESNKIILREALSEKWPESVRQRGKQGFGAPVSKWLNLPEVQSLKKQFLNDKSKKIFQLLSFENSRGFADKNNYQTWILLVLTIWMEKNNFDFQN